MSIIRSASFDYDPDITQEWSASLTGIIDLSGTLGRTGIGCMLLPAGVFGPYCAFGALDEIIVGGAVYPGGPGGIVFWLLNLAAGGLFQPQVQIGIEPDMSCSWYLGVPGGPAIQGASAPNVCTQNGYNFIEAHVVFRSTPTGAVTLRVNGVQVYTVSGVNTTGFLQTPFCDGVRLGGLGGVATTRHDDFYILNPLAPPNDSFLGPVRIYACMPFEDSAPLDWTPSVAGPHFPLVNSIPPDLTKWVESNIVGQQDQYRHDVSAIPPTINVLGVNHKLLAALDAPGARSVASCLNGIVHPTGAALSITPNQVLTPYDVDPVTGVAFTLANLTTARVFGPAVSA